MEELLNSIANEINEIKRKKDLIQGNKAELYRLKSNKEMLRNKDKSLKTNLKKVNDNITESMSKLLQENRNLNHDIRELTQSIVDKFTSEVEARKNIIESNKNELYRLKSNKEKFRNKDNSLKPELKKVYEDITKEMSKLLKENKQLNTEVRNIEGNIEDIQNGVFDKFIIKEQDKKQEGVTTSVQKSVEKTIEQVDNNQMEEPKEDVKEQIEEPEADIIEPIEENETNVIEQTEEPEENLIEKLKNAPDKEEVIKQEQERAKREDEEIKKAIDSESGNSRKAQKQEAQKSEKTIEQLLNENSISDNSNNRDNLESDENSFIDLNNVTLKDVDAENPEYSVNADILNSRQTEKEAPKFIEQVTMAIEKMGIMVNSSDAKELLKKAPKSIKKTLLEKVNDGIRFDGNIALGLIDNEEQLNKYLEICEKYDDLSLIGAENAEARAELAKFLPEIEYSFKNLRKSDMDISRKLRIYQNAKLTQKIYKEFGRGKDVKIKMNIFDKIYFGIANLKTNMNSKDILSEGENSAEDNHNGLAERLAKTVSEQQKLEDFAERMADAIENAENDGNEQAEPSNDEEVR